MEKNNFVEKVLFEIILKKYYLILYKTKFYLIFSIFLCFEFILEVNNFKKNNSCLIGQAGQSDCRPLIEGVFVFSHF